MPQRIDCLDIAKLIGLALVCFCHIPMPAGEFHVWVYSFHMPLFFLLSGLFFKPEKFSFKKSVMQLLVPFVLFNTLAIIISVWSCTGQLHPIKWLMGGYVIGPSWFLFSLFIIRVFCTWIYKYVKTRSLVVVTIVLLVIFVLTKESVFWNILSFGSMILGLPFYLIGYVAKEKFLNNVNYGGVWFTILMVVISSIAVLNDQVGIHIHSYGNNIIAFLFFGMVGATVLVRLSQYIRVPHKILDTFMHGALFYICMHTLMFEYMILIWNKVTDDFSGNTLTEKTVVTFLTFVVSYPIIRFMLRYTPILLGKQAKK